MAGVGGSQEGPPVKAPRPARPPVDEDEVGDDGEPLFVMDPSRYLPDDSRRYYTEESDDGPEYHIFNRQEKTAGLVLYEDDKFGGVEIVARVARLSGNKDGGYGIVFLSHDARNFYCVLVTANQDFCVSRLRDNAWSDLVDWSHSEHICGGDDENEIAVGLFPGMIRIWINGTLVEVVRTTLPDRGGLGLVAASANMHVVCRRLEVRRPRPQG